jgi:DNA cross-link repair 1A protein
MAPPARRPAEPKTPRQTKLNFGSATNGSANKNSASKQKRASNGNILNFFKKVEVEETLFLDGPSAPKAAVTTTTISKLDIRSPREDVDAAQSSNDNDNDSLFGEEEDISSAEEDDKDKITRFNEDPSGSSKRRKLSHDETNGVARTDNHELQATVSSDQSVQPSIQRKQKKARKGPFLDDSDSEHETPAHSSPIRQDDAKGEPPDDAVLSRDVTTGPYPNQSTLLRDESCPTLPEALPPPKDEDSADDNFKNLDEMEGIFDEEFDDVEHGEEYRYMRFMEEQARLEAEEAETFAPDQAVVEESPAEEGLTEACPLCSASLDGLTPDQATVHVNGCLDGKPVPLPTPSKAPSPMHTDQSPLDMSKRFARAAVPRPGQANPISLGNSTSSKSNVGSAFFKLMSGHAEDAAWATAAADENASRGKPAYKRTCPFYKIMPGFFICVDAFRYGAVKGCNAYFLSHFHSDHYIGLTANWSHGPIYCSKVTGSLIKSQLRTDAKWIKEIEFEETIEIPGTEGVTVTMIPANHCPGSSLFLFEKALGKGPNQRKQRILHCGDFRACPAQVTHPYLKPDIIDAISGRTRQQKIDVCYLDTTYLNPRYSFPPQDDVIRACAEFCKSIPGDPNGTDDIYEALKRGKGAESMTKFFAKESSGCGNKPTMKPGQQTTLTENKHRVLVVCGTYSIGKERICKAIAQALGSKIYAPPAKNRIVKQLGDPELAELLTSDPREAQVHMQMLMEIRAETLQEYLNGYKPHFSRIVGFRPSGWNFRGTSSPGTTGAASAAFTSNANTSPAAIATTALLHGPAWRPRFAARDLVAQRGSSREAMCFGVPYSEHSSFRELALFVMALRVEKIVPTVNVGSDVSRRRMKGWLDRWMAERRRGGVVRVLKEDDADNEEREDEGGKNKQKGPMSLWEGKDGRGGGVVW